eukprot:TRINITY_DN462_c0_g5_i1.p1 TRINITY_DN462_c0_g5~~TRINITY_DN462_c0_g5_i1.p1  ORF type:complete len:484 (+),score=68.77 TRINITY_DN462_c0_g5_i1:165-1616(+)
MLSLMAMLPSREEISIDVAGTDTMRKLRQKIATEAGLEAESITLSFEGEELLDDCEAHRCPFEDMSTLDVQLTKKAKALRRLKEANIQDNAVDYTLEHLKRMTYAMNKHPTDDNSLAELIQVVVDAQIPWSSTKKSMALRVAAEANFFECVETILTQLDMENRVELRSLLHSMLRKGTRGTQVASLLVQHNVDLNGEAENPLCLAVRFRCGAPLVRLMLEHNADPNRSGPLNTAVEMGELEVANLILSFGGDPNISSAGRYPLHHAMLHKDTTFAKMLFHYGADSNKLDSNGMTVLHAAVGFRNTDVIPLLFKHGVDADRPDASGYTALQIAETFDVDITNVLLKYVPDPTKATVFTTRDEETVWGSNVKLREWCFGYGGGRRWEVKAIGELHMMRCRNTNTTRVLVRRRELTCHRIYFCAYLSECTPLVRPRMSSKTWALSGSNFADTPVGRQQCVSITFPTAAVAASFADIFASLRTGWEV